MLCIVIVCHKAGHSLEGPHHPTRLSWTVPQCPISGTWAMQLWRKSTVCTRFAGHYRAMFL